MTTFRAVLKRGHCCEKARAAQRGTIGAAVYSSMALWILPALMLLDAPPTTEIVAANSSILALRASGATCNMNKTLPGLHTTARFCKTMDKTFCGWFWAAANVPTARDLLVRNVADGIVAAKPLDLEDCRPNVFMKQSVAVGWTCHGVWDGMMTELHLEGSDWQADGAIRSRTDVESGCCEPEPSGLHLKLLWGGERIVPHAEVGRRFWKGERE